MRAGDDPLEQVVLTLDIIKFHSGECAYLIISNTLQTYTHLVSNPAFPRSQVMESLLHVIKQQPKLAKEASSCLIDIGQAIHVNVTPNETNTLLRGTLMQEVYVRTSCLQALQVSVAIIPSFMMFNMNCLALRSYGPRLES